MHSAVRKRRLAVRRRPCGLDALSEPHQKRQRRSMPYVAGQPAPSLGQAAARRLHTRVRRRTKVIASRLNSIYSRDGPLRKQRYGAARRATIFRYSMNPRFQDYVVSLAPDNLRH